MTRPNLRWHMVVLRLFALLFVSLGSVRADLSLVSGLYGVPYQWHMRKTAFYDPIQQELFFGSLAPNAGANLLVSTISGSDGYCYTPAGLTPGDYVDSNGFDKRPVWDMNLVYQGTTPTPWLLTIMSNMTGTAPAAQMYASNVTPNAFASFGFSTFTNASSAASLPFKVCMAERWNGAVAAADKQVFVVAIAGSVDDTTFNSTTAGACLKLYQLNPGSTTFTGFGTSTFAMSNLGSFADLRDMWWDTTLKRLYCAFSRTDVTKTGVACFYLDESTPSAPVIKLLRDAELLTAPGSGASLIPCVHKVRTFCANPTDTASLQNKYLILCGGQDANSYNRIYALPLVNRANPALTAQGAIDTKSNSSVSGTSGSGVTAHDDSWLDQVNDVTNLTAGYGSRSVIAARTVGGGPLPVSPTAPVTDIQIVGLTVYVSVADDSGAPCLYASKAIVTDGSGNPTSTPVSGANSKLIGWNPWMKVIDASFNNTVASFGVADTGSKLVALLDNNTVVARTDTSFPVFSPVLRRSFSTVSSTGFDLADLTTMWRNRQFGVVDPVSRILYAGTANTSAASDALLVYTSSTPLLPFKSTQLTSDISVFSGIYNMPTWTMAMYGSQLLVVPHTELGQSHPFGGKRMYTLAYSPLGVTLTGTNTATDVKDKAVSPAASRIVNVAVGQKDSTTKVILAAIPQADRDDFSSGHNNCIRSFTIPDTTTTIVPLTNDDTFTYALGSGASALALQSGQSGAALTYRSLEDMYYDVVYNVAYLAFTKSTDGVGSDVDPGLAFVGWSLDGATSRVSGKLLEGNVDDATGFKHVMKVRTLHTRADAEDAADNRSYLLINATNYAGVEGDGANQASVALNRIYCLPLVVDGSDVGKIATSTTHDTKAVLAVNAWSETGSSGANYAKHVVGGGYLPTHPRSVVTGMVVVGRTVFVSVANPQGVVGARGIFATTAVTDNDEKLVSWTSWKQIGGGNENIAFLGYCAASDSLIAINHDSSNVEEIAWKQHVAVDNAKPNYQNLVALAKTLEADFPANKRGMYNIHNAVIATANNATTSHMLVAHGYDSLAIAHLIKKTSGDAGTVKYPHKLDTKRYLYFANDAVLTAIKSLYCVAVPTRAPGWVFAAGYRGLAVLRDASTGRGWTSLPSSLSDASSGIAITAQTWKQIPDVVGPVYKMITITTADMSPLVICMTKQGLQAFVAKEGKFKTTSPDDLGLFDASSIFRDSTEYMRDIAYVGGKMFLVGTTKGLYMMQVNDTNDGFVSVPTPIYYGGKMLGPIGSIRVTHPVLATATSLNPSGLNNSWITVDLVTARVTTDQSEHYRFKVNLNNSGVLETPASMTPLTLVRSFTHLEGKIFTAGNANSYILPGKHLTTSGSVDVLANDAASSVAPMSVVQNDAQIGGIADVAADGARVVTAGGSVYVYKA